MILFNRPNPTAGCSANGRKEGRKEGRKKERNKERQTERKKERKKEGCNSQNTQLLTTITLK
jgi:hypothetical protein